MFFPALIPGLYLELIGGLEHFLFFHILGIIIPTDFHIFQRGRYTTNQLKVLAIAGASNFQHRGTMELSGTCRSAAVGN